FLLIFFHHKVSTYFGGHLMHQSTQQQKVRGNSRLLNDRIPGNAVAGGSDGRVLRRGKANLCAPPLAS
ncbi:hypothetical protein, partial [Mesorhizobium sp. M0684]|uniref:hypothetical protein n=1 Tax=Mesorhizobium sp. M0684 TaxID=2956986 RepID=UPI00333B7CCA